MRSTLLFVVLVALTAPVAADEMTCENPRRSYSAVFNETARTFVLDLTSEYKVLAVEDTPERLVVAGMVGFDSGLGFVAEFRPTPRIVFYSNDAAVQTDRCQ